MAAPCYCYVRPRTEKEMHRTLVGFLRVSLEKPWLFNHCPNEGKRGWQAQRDLGIMGVTTGWPDLELIGPPSGSTHFLELKHGSNKPTEAQERAGKDLVAAGARYALCYSYTDILAALTAWSVPLRVNFVDYVDAWTRKDRLSAMEYATLILGAAPKQSAIIEPATPRKTTKKVPDGTVKNGRRVCAA